METVTFSISVYSKLNELEIFQHSTLERNYLRILKEESNTLNIYRYSTLFGDYVRMGAYGLNPDIRKIINTLGERQ